jgi:uncharacterized protein YndB with AHSA1/START domain
MESPRSVIGPLDDLVIARFADLPLAPAAAFELFTQSSQLQSWLCRRAIVEPRVGGRYELYWDLDDAENDSTIGCRVTAIDPERLLAFQWRSPRQFKAFANAADPLTHVVVGFHAVGAGTRVSLVHSGWRSSQAWCEAAQWQGVAWNHAFRALVARAASAA